MLLRSISLIFILSLSAQTPVHAMFRSYDAIDADAPEISEGYKLFHNMALSFALSAYFTGADSNKLTADMSEWQFDWLTIFNVIWRTLLFTPINYLEYSYLPDGLAKGALTEEYANFCRGWMLWAASTSQMITYNSRYDDVLISRYHEYKSYLIGLGESASTGLAGAVIFLRNLVWFYTMPKLLKPINVLLFALLPRQQVVAGFAYNQIPSRVVQLLTFSLVDVLYKHLLVSIKHTAWQFLPTAQDLRIFRFDDCTTCYFGTNMMGKNGTIGSQIRAVRDSVIEAIYSSQNEEL